MACPRALHCGCIERHEYADLPLWLRQLEPYTELRTTHSPDLLAKVQGDARYQIKLAYCPHRLPEVFVQAPDVAPEAAPARDDRPIDICYLSRLERFQKRSHWLPEIIQICAQLGANLRWHIYGAGPAEAEVRQGLTRLGQGERVQFHGWLEPEVLAPRLGQHDVFFLCSRWEGLPAAMAEAMLCGQACVVPNFPAGMTFLVSTGGGWTYEATSPAACAQALVRAVADRAVVATRRREAQQIARSLYARSVIDQRLSEVDQALRSLTFNGRVCSVDTARRMQLVSWPTWLRRKWLDWTGRSPYR